MQKKKNNNKNKNKSRKTIRQGKVQRAPIAQTMLMTTTTPTIKGGVDSTVICHREFIRNLLGSSPFLCDSDGINPGNPDLFPWLSSVAQNFESYRFKKLSLKYEPTAPTTQAGSVMMVIDYDPEDSLPAIKSDLLSNWGATRSTPWAPFYVTLDISRLTQKIYFVRGHIYPSERKLYDCAQIIWATEGCGGNNVGEFWIEYEVELLHPQRSSMSFAAKRVESVDDVSVHNPLAGCDRWGQLGLTPATSGGFNFRLHSAGEYLAIMQLRGTFTANPVTNLQCLGGVLGTVKNNYVAGLTDVYLIIPIRAEKPDCFFGIDLTTCMSSIKAPSQGSVRLFITQANFETTNGVDPNPS